MGLVACAIGAWGCSSSDSTTLTPSQPECDGHTVEITPPSAQLHLGDTLRLSVALVASCGFVPPSGPQTFSWRVSDTTLATISGSPATALVRARGTGNVTVIARWDADSTIRGAAAILIAP
jgi:hypothetical protein